MKTNAYKQVQRYMAISLAGTGLLSTGIFSAKELAAEELVLEEVVVTAQKRVESIQDVPMSISALSSSAIERKGFTNAGDLIGSVPNMHGFEAPGSRGNLSLSIRGVSAGSPSNISIDPSTAIYLDGVYVGKTTGLALDVADLERVEILRGPQGTLYGRNATGGAVGFITKKPDGEFGGKVIATTGSDGLKGLNATINLPGVGKVGDGAGRLATSLAFQTRERDPLFDNDNAVQDGFDSLDRQALRFALRWQPTEFFTVDYAFDSSELNEDASLQQLAGLTPTDAISGPGFTPVPRLAALQGSLEQAQQMAFIPDIDERLSSRLIPSMQALIDAYSQTGDDDRPDSGAADIKSFTESEASGHSLTLRWGLENLEIRSITGYREVENRNVGEMDGIDNSLDANGVGAINDGALLSLFGLHAGIATGEDTIPGIPNVIYPNILNQVYQDIDTLGGVHSSQDARSDYQQSSQELQFVGAIDNLEYVVGLYWFEDEGVFETDKLFAAPVGPFQGTNYDNKTTAQAIFAQGTFRPEVLNERLSFTGGVRYTKEEKEITYNYLTAGGSFERVFWGFGQANPPEGFDPANPYQLLPTSDFGTSAKEDFDNVSGTFTVAMQTAENASVFIRYATGYRSGGFNGESLSSDLEGNPQPNAFEEETIAKWEIGFKSQLWNRRLQLNAALFRFEFDDAQVSTIGLSPSGAVTSAIRNAASATREGGEIELIVLLMEDLLLSFSASYLDGDFDDYDYCGDNPNCFQEAGTSINDNFVADFAERANSPDKQLNLGIDYTLARMAFGAVNFHMDLAWRDEAAASALWTNAQRDGDQTVYDPIEYQESTLINARLTLEEVDIGGGQVSVALWGKNLSDEEYQTFGINFGGLAIITEQWGSPRTYGLDLGYRF